MISSGKTYDAWHLTKGLLPQVSRRLVLIGCSVNLEELEGNLLLMENLGYSTGSSRFWETIKPEDHINCM